MPLHLDGKSKPGPLGMDWQRVALAHEKRIAELETALRGIIDHWNEFGYMMRENNDDYGLSERMDAAEKLLK